MIRAQLAADLAPALDGWTVAGYPATLQPIHEPTLRIWQAEVTRPPQVSLTRVGLTLTLWVLSPFDAVDKADDHLDALLVDLFAALQPLTYVDWTTATRGVLADTYHGYEVTAQAWADITTEE